MLAPSSPKTVRLADTVIKALGQERWQAFGRVRQKQADLVLLDPATCSLGDASRRRQDCRERDELAKAVYEAAGLTLWPIPV